MEEKIITKFALFLQKRLLCIPMGKYSEYKINT